MKEILPDVLRWHWFSIPHGYLFNGYLLRLPGRRVCIDPVQGDELILETLARERPELIILTNRNHSRMANAVADRTGAVTAMHPADAAYAKAQGTRIDHLLEPGSAGEKELLAPLVAVPMPGKSPGEIALHWPERRMLIIGDALIGDPPGGCRLLRPQVIDDLPELRKSVRALLDLDFDTLLVGDGEPILRGAKDRVRELARSFDN